MKYDPETCITAGEMREAGWDIGDNIHDSDWVPLQSIHLDPMAPHQWTKVTDSDIGDDGLCDECRLYSVDK